MENRLLTLCSPAYKKLLWKRNSLQHTMRERIRTVPRPKVPLEVEIPLSILPFRKYPFSNYLRWLMSHLTRATGVILIVWKTCRIRARQIPSSVWVLSRNRPNNSFHILEFTVPVFMELSKGTNSAWSPCKYVVIGAEGHIEEYQ